jgi:DNA adenine methylase
MKVPNHISPLRYPGGKSRISKFLEDIILLNNLEGCHIYELYAGGAGASLNLLFSGICHKIILNDLDNHIFAFWESILNETDLFIEKIRNINVNLDSWHEMNHIYNNENDFDLLDIGFATFFLNRTNRSGIIFKAGPIGGHNQEGNYKIDVRFNKSNLIKRIIDIASYKEKITIHKKESISYLKYIFQLKRKKLVFLDPPYFHQGENLYLNFYKKDDHQKLADILNCNHDKNWVLTYDNADFIKKLYNDSKMAHLPMSHTLQKKKIDKEIFMSSHNLHLPKNLRMGSKSQTLELLKN